MKEIESVLFTEEQIENKCCELGKRISTDYDEEVLVVGILKGAVPFMSELVKRIEIPIRMDFMDVSSYDGSVSTGKVKILKDVENDVRDKDVLIVEDIIDTGNTLSYLTELFKLRGAKSVTICSLLTKPSRRLKKVDAKYIGFEIEDYFVVGYGMDYNERFRNLPYIGILSEEVYK